MTCLKTTQSQKAVVNWHKQFLYGFENAWFSGIFLLGQAASQVIFYFVWALFNYENF